MTQVQNFMLLFKMQPTTEQPTAEQLQQMEQQWGQFIGNIAMQGKLVNTYQLGFNGMQILANQTTVDGFEIAEGKTLSGNMVIKADTLEAATELAKNCPILLMGGTVEVRNIIPMN
jgi:hypothetical protein